MDHPQQIEITLQCRPLGERHERGVKNHAESSESVNDMQEIFARMALVESAEHSVIQIFHRADDEETAGVSQLWQVRLVFLQVLDFYSHVVSYIGKLTVKFFAKLHRVTNAVKKIRIAEGNVLRAGGHLISNVLHHDVATDDSEDPFINRYDWAMAAKMFAATAGFRGTDEAESAARNNEMGVLVDGWHFRTVWNFEGEAFQGHKRSCVCQSLAWIRAIHAGFQALSELSEFALEFAAEDGRDAQRSQIVRVHRRVQAIAAQFSEGIQFAQDRDQFCSQTCGCVHRQVNGDQPSFVNRRFVERLTRKIEAGDLVPALAEPGCRRCEPKWLTAQLVSRNQNNVHVFNSIAGHPP